MSFFNNLFRKQPVTDYENNMPPLALQQVQEGPQVQVLKPQRPVTFGQRFENAMLGVPEPVQQPETNLNADENGNVIVSSGVATAPRTGGFLNDIAKGFNQNYNNGFNLDNLAAKNQGGGQGTAFRGGEAMGTLARQFAKLKDPNVLNGLSLAMAAGSDLLGNYHGSAQSPSLTNLYNMNYKNKQLEYMNDYRKELVNTRREQNLLRAAIANESSANRKAQMIFSGVNNGILTPQQGTFMLKQYGIDPGTMQESNQSKLIEKGWADYGLRADKAEQEGMIKEAVANYIKEMNKNNGASAQNKTVRVKGPSGKVGYIPASQWDEAQKEGYTKI
jgi:hypothetical protein